jgi:hypothetical protein
MEQISYELGSGGYQSPWLSAAVLTSALNAPGSATATPRGGVDLNGAHAFQRDHDAAVDGRRPARQPAARPTGHHRDPMLRGPTYGHLHVLGRLCSHCGDRRARIRVFGPVEPVFLQPCGIGDHHAVGQAGDQIVKRRSKIGHGPHATIQS